MPVRAGGLNERNESGNFIQIYIPYNILITKCRFLHCAQCLKAAAVESAICSSMGVQVHSRDAISCYDCPNEILELEFKVSKKLHHMLDVQKERLIL